MRNNISLVMGASLIVFASAYAVDYKINKVGSEENQLFDIIYNQKIVTEAAPGAWVTVSPNVPDGKHFKSFTVYDEYGEKSEDQKVSSTAILGQRFLMPNHDVYVKASYESLRYYINKGESEHGSVSFSFSDRVDIPNRTKPGFKVTVTPKADDGYKLSSIKVSRYLDSKTTVYCAKSEAAVGPGLGSIPGVAVAEGTCVFEMPSFDVNITATFVAQNEDVPKVDLKGKKFHVSYELNGGKLPEDAEKSFSCESQASLPVPTKDGFDFVGWSLENKLDNIYLALKSLDGSVCTDTKVYAIWATKDQCLEQKAIAVEGDGRFPVCSSNIKCALVHSNTANQDSVCNGAVWTSDKSILPSSSSVAPSSSSAAPSSSSTAPSSSSVAPASSSVKVESSSSAKPASSSANATSSSADKPASSSANATSSSADKPASSSAKATSSSADKPASSSANATSSSADKPASSSAKATSSSADKPASSSAKATSSSADKPASSSAKATSSSSKKDSSSSSKAKSSSSVETVVESVKTEEDLPSCTSKRENVTYYVSELKKVFVCKDRKWTQFDPNGIPVIAHAAKFSAAVNGRQLQVSGAKVGSQVNLLDLQGRVVYSGQANAANFTMNLARSGTFVLRIGTQQKIVNVR